MNGGVVVVQQDGEIHVVRFGEGAGITVKAKDVLDFFDQRLNQGLGRCQERIPDHTDFINCEKIAVIRGNERNYCSEHGTKKLQHISKFANDVLAAVSGAIERANTFE
jgi:hypothetical protein